MKPTLTLTSLTSGKLTFPRTELLLLLVAAFWGTSYGVTKSALVFTTVFMFMAIRFLLTFAILSYPTVRDFRAKRNTDWKVAIPTGVILLAIFCCEIIGVSKTTATNAAVLISLSAVLTAFLEVFVNRKPLNWRLLFLSAFSIIGVYLLNLNVQFTFALTPGDWLILLAALLRAVMVTTTKRLTHRKRITTLSLTALQSLVVGVGALILLIIQPTGTGFTIPKEWEFWTMTLYLVLFCTLFAFFVQNYAVRKTSPTKVSLLMGSEPLFGALFAFCWLGEALNPIQVIGALFILTTMFFVTTQKM